MKRVRVLLGALACVAALALYVILPAGGCGGKAAPAGPGAMTPGLPVETRPPNGKDQKPAFAGQTRAPYLPSKVTFEVKVITNKLQKEGLEQPLYFWDPSIGPSGMAFYIADLFPEWRGSLFVGALSGKHLVRLALDGERIVGEERLLADRARIRDVRVGPDGSLYVLTDEDPGELLTLTRPH